MEETKAMTLRLSREQAEELEAVAEVEGRPVAEVVREAITKHIDTRTKDSKFQALLKARLERNKRILQKLSKR
jgi:predicted DNA-binding protein